MTTFNSQGKAVAQPKKPLLVCFGMFNGAKVCESCPAKSPCKNVAASHMLDIMGELVEHLATTLPDTNFVGSERIPVLVDQLLTPEDRVSPIKDIIDLIDSDQVAIAASQLNINTI